MQITRGAAPRPVDTLPVDRNARRDQPSVRCVNDSRSLSQIHEPGVDLVIWERLAQTSPDLAALAVTDKMLQNVSNWRQRLSINAIAQHVSRMPEPLGRDIAQLAQLFAGIAKASMLEVRLERVVDNACWKFHRDAVHMRLLTSYAGPGTEWVAAPDAEQALVQQGAYRGPIGRLQRFDVGIFKGRRYQPEPALVHRSPAIAGTGEQRLLLCMTPVDGA